MRVKEESEKAGLKLNIKKTNIIAANPIRSWQIEEGKVGSSDFIFLGSKITEDSSLPNTFLQFPISTVYPRFYTFFLFLRVYLDDF